MTKRRRPFVAVETDVAKDESFSVLADVCGYSRDEALGRVIRLWAWCADRKLQDAPEGCPGYAVPEGVVTRFLGPDGVRGILGDGVPQFALGERWGDLIYLRGTDATVAARRSKVDGAVAGGETRAREVLATGARGGDGKFVTRTTINQPTRHPEPADSPPRTSVDPRSQIPDPRFSEHSLPRAILPSTEQAAAPAPAPGPPAIVHRDTTPLNVAPPILPGSIARAETRRRVITAGWQLGGDAYRELGREGIEPTARDPWAEIPAASDPAMERLGEVVDRLLVGDSPDGDAAIAVIANRVEVAKAEARRKNPPTRRWMVPMRMWDRDSFAYASSLSPEQIQRPTAPARAGPTSSPTTGRVEPPPASAFRRGVQKI